VSKRGRIGANMPSFGQGKINLTYVRIQKRNPPICLLPNRKGVGTGRRMGTGTKIEIREGFETGRERSGGRRLIEVVLKGEGRGGKKMRYKPKGLRGWGFEERGRAQNTCLMGRNRMAPLFSGQGQKNHENKNEGKGGENNKPKNLDKLKWKNKSNHRGPCSAAAGGAKAAQANWREKENGSQKKKLTPK